MSYEVFKCQEGIGSLRKAEKILESNDEKFAINMAKQTAVKPMFSFIIHDNKFYGVFVNGQKIKVDLV